MEKTLIQLLEKAKKFHLSGKLSEAQKIYLNLIKKNKNNGQLYFLLGTSFLQNKKYDLAIKNLDISIKLNPKISDSYNNIGIALAEIGDYENAIKNYDEALNLNINHVDCYVNKAIALKNLKLFEQSLKCFENAIRLNNKNFKAYNGLGNLYKELNKLPLSLENYNLALKINPNYSDALINKATVLKELKQYQFAIDNFIKAFSLNPNQEYLLGKIFHCKMHICDWKDYDKTLDQIKKSIINDRAIFDPLAIKTLIDDENLDKMNTEKFFNKEYGSIQKLNFKFKNKEKKKIKIGYYSADYHDHPVLHSIRDILKQHDKSKFEIYAFSHGERNNNSFREEIKKLVDKFINIEDMSDQEVINLSRNLDIDIAVNLTGFTKNERTSIYIKRIAPTQINYLGYPGTMGTNCFDYILADQVTIPKEKKKFYSEKVLYLPNCYLPMSHRKEVKTNNTLRSDFKLPENKVIFCSFNNQNKITPHIFDIWINILKRVDKSILWILVKNSISQKNIILEAEKRNLDPKRIIFAERTENIEDHLARLELADICLDTFPYNAHSTTYDNIRAGLPMVTMMGNSFASRVAASIYSSINMNELIAKDKNEYEKIAFELGTNKKKLANLKNKIKAKTKECISINSIELTKNLENIYIKISKKN